MAWATSNKAVKQLQTNAVPFAACCAQKLPFRNPQQSGHTATKSHLGGRRTTYLGTKEQPGARVTLMEEWGLYCAGEATDTE